MARTDTLGNFLTDVAEAIRAKEGTTGTINASEFDTRIANLSGGGTSGGGETTGQPYIFAQSVGERSDVTSITIGTQAQFIERITNYTGVNTDNVTILIFGWVRGEYSLSDNITLLAETETFSSANQKTIVGVYDLSSSDIPTIYQTTTGRMGMAYVMLANCDTPEVFLNYTGPTNNSLITLETDNYLNIFYSSYNHNAANDLFHINNFETFGRRARTTLTISSSAGTDKSIDPNGSNDQYGMLGVRCKYKRVL